MGADLAETDEKIFDHYLGMAEDASGLPIRKLCLEGPIEDLTRTDVVQPALFAVGIALTEVARGLGPGPDFVAGHSLGEYTAAAASGALCVEDGMRLVSERGRRMADVQTERPGAMAAIIGLPAETVGELCKRAAEAGVVGLANLNTPTQTVISGEEAGVTKAMELADEEGASKTIRLPVGGAFHSELMKPVQAALAETAGSLSFGDPTMPLVTNHSGKAVTSGAEVREALVAQIAAPVRWADCVRTLVEEGCDRAVELGPGKVLSGLVRKIDSGLQTVSGESRGALAALPRDVPNAADRRAATDG